MIFQTWPDFYQFFKKENEVVLFLLFKSSLQSSGMFWGRSVWQRFFQRGSSLSIILSLRPHLLDFWSLILGSPWSWILDPGSCTPGPGSRSPTGWRRPWTRPPTPGGSRSRGSRCETDMASSYSSLHCGAPHELSTDGRQLISHFSDFFWKSKKMNGQGRTPKFQKTLQIHMF